MELQINVQFNTDKERKVSTFLVTRDQIWNMEFAYRKNRYHVYTWLIRYCIFVIVFFFSFSFSFFRWPTINAPNKRTQLNVVFGCYMEQSKLIFIDFFHEYVYLLVIITCPIWGNCKQIYESLKKWPNNWSSNISFISTNNILRLSKSI